MWQEPHWNPHSPELCSGRGMSPGCVDVALHVGLESTVESGKEDPNVWHLNSDLRGGRASWQEDSPVQKTQGASTQRVLVCLCVELDGDRREWLRSQGRVWIATCGALGV